MTAALQRLDDLGLADKQNWTVDDLASLPEDLRYELIDGRLILPSPTGMHQILGMDVAFALRPGCPPDYAPAVDLSLKMNPSNEPRPDVVVGKRSSYRRSPVPVDDALLAVEIISPSSRSIDMVDKVAIYAKFGIQHYWVLDPWLATGAAMTVFRLERGVYEFVVKTQGVFRTEVPFPVTLDLPALTDQWRDDDHC
jgi:Uma2 family endonuclease